ncbi:hypothetical protein LTR62_001488 [Meristemomyces frigidus]|uniref:Uncharacterized protein n=1 Tax=Meristemomyces frigidus TaxID=1508187 RepID=A0AAN7TK79_9PEZI|nr:hypothetical protein LTR62_001488 [Meristemomyces frigidus]
MSTGAEAVEGRSKADLIEERKANLPLPDQPPVASDFNSADTSINASGSGAISDTFSAGNDALRSPATGDSAARTDGSVTGEHTLGQGVGREGLEGGIPNDAVARGAKDKAGLKDTTGKDYGYPQKNDPADTSK